MKPTVVILTTNFGTNFSGGATATCEVFNRIQHEFNRIIVLGSRVGDHAIRNLVFFRTYNWLQTLILLIRLKGKGFLFYGDFYNAFLLASARVPYVFTYHDNWPELAGLSLKHVVQNIYYSSAYRFIFRNAKHLVTVSDFKRQQLEKHSSLVSVIPNGYHVPESIGKAAEAKGQGIKKILMVGNIDARKYLLADRLFKRINPAESLQIDIYGHTVDQALAEQLGAYPFVALKGFVADVPYSNYTLLLHTSYTESFGMVFCEAIHQQVPVLTFDHGGARELINEKNGKMISNHWVDKMHQEMLRMVHDPLSADPDTVKKYSWDFTSEQYKKLFHDLA